MNLLKLGMTAAVGAMLALPVMAQTATGTAGKSPAASRAATMPAPPARTGTTTATTAPQGGLVDINSASQQQLDDLPGIGKARADAIVKNRPYKGKDDLLSRHIIPQNVYNGIKDKIIARQG